MEGTEQNSCHGQKTIMHMVSKKSAPRSSVAKAGQSCLGKKSSNRTATIEKSFHAPKPVFVYRRIGVSARACAETVFGPSVYRCMGARMRRNLFQCIGTSAHARAETGFGVSVHQCARADTSFGVSLYRRETHLADLSNKPFEKVAIVLFGNTPGTKQVLSDGGLLPNLTERPCGCALERRHWRSFLPIPARMMRHFTSPMWQACP